MTQSFILAGYSYGLDWLLSHSHIAICNPGEFYHLSLGGRHVDPASPTTKVNT